MSRTTSSPPPARSRSPPASRSCPPSPSCSRARSSTTSGTLLLRRRWVEWLRNLDHADSHPQDYHPEGHISFASSHPGHKAYQTIETRDARGFDYEQMLWPDHCVQGTKGAEIHADLLPKLQAYGDKFKLIRKGFHKGVEAYSAFDGVISDGANPPDLPTEIDPQPARKIVQALRAEGITKVVVVGLAGDICVSHTALSALSSRFDTAVYLPATRAINGRDADENFDKLVAFGGSTIGNKKSDRWYEQLNTWVAK
ncbi:hypothetical protein VHUM_03581 [Vanrija humicola]|uniref:nicotinamidase n=1 Tax=Vanrija humicola TaxID=5417 RepID=A0A7D8Z6N4_VANHU|nr:hypothetical protein VHUM_03581 [Vanrija humicola]